MLQSLFIHYMQVVKLQKTQPATTLSFETLIQLGPFAQWTMDCKISSLLNSDQAQHSDWVAILELGLSDNTVETHELQMQEGKLVSHLCEHERQPPHPEQKLLTPHVA